MILCLCIAAISLHKTIQQSIITSISTVSSYSHKNLIYFLLNLKFSSEMLRLFIIATIAIATVTCESSDGMKNIDELIPDVFQVPSTPKSALPERGGDDIDALIPDIFQVPVTPKSPSPSAGGGSIDDLINNVFQIPSTDGTINPNSVTQPITPPPHHTTPPTHHTSDGNQYNTDNGNSYENGQSSAKPPIHPGVPNPTPDDLNEPNVSTMLSYV